MAVACGDQPASISIKLFFGPRYTATRLAMLTRQPNRRREPSGGNKPVNRRAVDTDTFRDFGDI